MECLNVKCKTINYLEVKIGENLWNIGFDKDSLDITPRAQNIQEKMDKRDLNKIKNCFLQKIVFKKLGS